MLPPSFLPDLRVELRPDVRALAFEDRAPQRRGAPARLRLVPLPPAGPALRATPVRGPRGRVGRPSGLRLRLGLMLIVWGRRLAGPRAQ